jgi:hypothetical protein
MNKRLSSGSMPSDRLFIFHEQDYAYILFYELNQKEYE